ncbi:MAG TPA: nitrogenase component 1 [Termitinemataceae bacterium]|nr:nitrogenase component 1 [Termitinemataceae bacterium]
MGNHTYKGVLNFELKRPTGASPDFSLKEEEVPEKSSGGVENPCHLCAPLGAVVFFAGFEGGITILHGSQGCSTYVRRYLISHFREPVDVASSNFIEASTIFGGKDNVQRAIGNVIRQYTPKVIGIATTCLVETMGEDIYGIVKEMEARYPEVLLIPVSTPGFLYNHREGFQLAQSALLRVLATRGNTDIGPHHKTDTDAAGIPFGNNVDPLREPLKGAKVPSVLLFPNFASPADLRWYKRVGEFFDISLKVVGDYSQTLDSGPWLIYRGLASGGTAQETIATLFRADAVIGIGSLPLKEPSPAEILQRYTHIPAVNLPVPIGLGYTDLFMKHLSSLSGHPIPSVVREERARLQDAYVDAHKYVATLPCAVVGDEDLVLSLASFLLEIGARPVFCASGGKTGYLRDGMLRLQAQWGDRWPQNFEPVILSGTDFQHVEELIKRLGVRLILGSSKAYTMARTLGIPLVRCGFPIHDRFGASQILHVGYEGTYNLLRLVVNALIEQEQETNPVGYTYY